MHEIDKILKLNREGKSNEAKRLSDYLESLGPEKILDNEGKNNQDIWFRHCFNRGWFFFQQGDFQKGSQLLEHGRFLNVYGSKSISNKKPIFNPKEHNLKNKTILVSLEGGLGDEIIQIRFINSLKKFNPLKILVCCSKNLFSVFQRISSIDQLILRNELESVEFDYWVPGFSIGWICGHTFDDFPKDPYLTLNNIFIDKWKNIINSKKIKVGIRWAGNPDFEHQQQRCFSEKFLTNLCAYDELQIYSFQRDENLSDLSEKIIDLKDSLYTWEDTLAALSLMDLVITSCTSIAHASAALGKETWVVVPTLPYYTWTPNCPESNTTPYYNSVKIFRQKTFEKWNETFQDLYSSIEEKFNLIHQNLPDEDSRKSNLNLFYSRKTEIEKAYIITLNSNKKSLEYSARCQKSCEAVEMPYEVWSAYDGFKYPIEPPKHLENNEIMRLIKVNDHYLTRGEVACALSHISLWAHCILIDQPIVILEHDAVMLQKITHHDNLNSIIYLGGVEWKKLNWAMQPIPPMATEGPNNFFICRAHAYSIDPLVAKNLLSYVIQMGIDKPLDMIIKSDLFNITHRGLIAYDENADLIDDTTIKHRPLNGRTTQRNDFLQR